MLSLDIPVHGTDLLETYIKLSKLIGDDFDKQAYSGFAERILSQFFDF